MQITPSMETWQRHGCIFEPATASRKRKRTSSDRFAPASTASTVAAAKRYRNNPQKMYKKMLLFITLLVKSRFGTNTIMHQGTSSRVLYVVNTEVTVSYANTPDAAQTRLPRLGAGAGRVCLARLVTNRQATCDPRAPILRTPCPPDPKTPRDPAKFIVICFPYPVIVRPDTSTCQERTTSVHLNYRSRNTARLTFSLTI